MFEIHTDAQGNEIRICEMTDKHLFNVIKIICGKISSDVAILNDPRNKAPNMVGGCELHLHELIRFVQPYMLEAMVRTAITDKVAVMFRDALERSQAYPRGTENYYRNHKDFFGKGYDLPEDWEPF